ncbi:MAG: hypothetical protein IT529_16215 [Burkholderiales bacterium]|nr:hypothetical protein [Burkholderiales bacterium]
MTAPVYLTALQCRELITPEDVLAEIERVVAWDAAGEVRWPEPRNMNMRDRFENHYHLKACILERPSVAGFRLVAHNATDETSRDATRFVLLVDVESSRPLALVDETWTYAQRTVASIVMAARRLARADAASLALVGAGRLAKTALDYYARLFRLRELRIASRRPETRGALAAAAGAATASPRGPRPTSRTPCVARTSSSRPRTARAPCSRSAGSRPAPWSRPSTAPSRDGTSRKRRTFSWSTAASSCARSSPSSTARTRPGGWTPPWPRS